MVASVRINMGRIEFSTFIKKSERLQGVVSQRERSFFTGSQGAGKTLSATHYLASLKVKFPNLYIYSNISLAIADKIITSDEVAKYILDRKLEGKLCGVCTVCTRKPEEFDNGELCEQVSEVPIAFLSTRYRQFCLTTKRLYLLRRSRLYANNERLWKLSLVQCRSF